MPVNVLKTKLFAPRIRTQTVPRPQLLHKLHESLERKLTLVSAPAGFGKTTLVCDWIRTLSHPVAWLSLDERDNELIQFLSCLMASLQSVYKGFGPNLQEGLQSLQTMGTEAFLTDFCNELMTFNADTILVLDDYHVINNQAVSEALAFLIQHSPEQIHFLITTRIDPLLPLAALRAKQQLLEIRATDLRFTYTETSAFLYEVMGLNLSDEDVRALETKTEGWIAGLQLAAVSMKHHHDVSGFIASFSGSHRFIMDYLMEEVLKQQSEGIQSFLLQTSLLDRLCGPLCDAVLTSIPGSGQEKLEYLQQANLFIIPLDDERQWYRYHHLFADLLKQRLSRGNSGMDGTAGLHMRASAWFDNSGLMAEAVYHALEAKDVERAAALIERAWTEMDRSSQSRLWLSWVKRIPDELIRKRPVLSAGYAWALLDSGDMDGCEPRLQDAEGCLSMLEESQEDQGGLHGIVVIDNKAFRSLPATIATARAYRSSAMGDTDGTIRYAKEALALLPSDDNHTRGVIAVMLGLALWSQGELEAACENISAGTSSDFSEVHTAVLLGKLKTEQGKLSIASRIYESNIESSLALGGHFLVGLPSMYLGLSHISHLRGDYQGTELGLALSLEYAEKAALPNWRYGWFLMKARLLVSQGETDKALDALREAEKHRFRSPMPEPVSLDAFRIRIYLMQGKIQSALQWLEERRWSEEEISYLNEHLHITMVRILIEEFRHYQRDESLVSARHMLELLYREALKGGRTGSILEILLLKAKIKNSTGHKKSAVESMRDAVLLAEPEGYVQVFAEEGDSIFPLLSHSDVIKTASGFVNKLLSRMAGQNEGVSSNRPQGCPVLAETLTEREREILQLIAQGLSNHEICNRLFLAISTVKGYNQNLFSKLQVKNRTEAVARARELRLI